MQFDNPERGFGSKVNGPLDMRMNPRRGQSTSNWLSTLEEDELSQIFRLNADEPTRRGCLEQFSTRTLSNHSRQLLRWLTSSGETASSCRRKRQKRRFVEFSKPYESRSMMSLAAWIRCSVNCRLA